MWNPGKLLSKLRRDNTNSKQNYVRTDTADTVDTTATLIEMPRPTAVYSDEVLFKQPPQNGTVQSAAYNYQPYGQVKSIKHVVVRLYAVDVRNERLVDYVPFVELQHLLRRRRSLQGIRSELRRMMHMQFTT